MAFVRGSWWALLLLGACGSFGENQGRFSDAGVDAAPTPRDPTVVAHWSFDDGSGTVARDDSGHARHAILNDGVTWTSGLLGGAGAFARDAEGRVMARIPGFGTGSFSIAAWVKSVDMASVQSRVFGFEGPGAYLWLNFNMGHPLVEGQTASAYWGASPVSTRSIADDLWHHVAVVVDRSVPQILLFVDGAEASRGGSSDPDASDAFGDPATEYGFVVGSQSAAYELRFGGSIDDVWVYARALKAAEVETLARPL